MSAHRPCKKCGEPIHFIITPAGKPMPCDPRETTIVTPDGEIKRGYIPHWDT